MTPRIAVAPANAEIELAVVAGGGTLIRPEEANAIVWSDLFDSEPLQQLLADSPAVWVQLPFAGTEPLLASGIMTSDRTWTCAKGIYGATCAELALGFMLLGARHLHRHARRETWWRESRRMHRRIAGTTALILGTGGIGRALASYLQPLEVSVIGVNRSGAPMPGAHRTEKVSALADVLPEADWVVVAAASTPETDKLFDAEMIAHMKPRAWLINVSRGRLVETDALVDALRRGAIAGAALDVTDPEPLPDGHPLWKLDNSIVTSHTANTLAMAMPELLALVRRNVERFAKGEPLEGLVDPVLGY